MTTSLLMFLFGGLTLILMGILLRRDGKKSSDQKNHGYGLISIYLGSYLLIIGGAHSFLHKTAWTDDSKQLFLFILIGTSLFFALLFGTSLLLHSLKSGSKIGLSATAVWTIASILTCITGFSKVASMNDGWTKENMTDLENACKSEGKYDCDCKLDYIIKNYPNKEEYNEKMGDEAKYPDKANMDIYLEKNCLRCDSLKMKRETQKIGEGDGGLPADF
jgi:hypothetical protein